MTVVVGGVRDGLLRRRDRRFVARTVRAARNGRRAARARRADRERSEHEHVDSAKRSGVHDVHSVLRAGADLRGLAHRDAPALAYGALAAARVDAAATARVAAAAYAAGVEITTRVRARCCPVARQCPVARCWPEARSADDQYRTDVTDPRAAAISGEMEVAT